LWDGGNNDLPFYKPDLHIVVVDPHRAGHELKYFPGEANLRMADVVVVNKIDSAKQEDIDAVVANSKELAPNAKIILAESPLTVADPNAIKGKKALVVEDGPTLTHGEMKYGAGVVAAKLFGAAELVDPRPYTVGAITDTFNKYKGIGVLLPAMGYGDQQVKDLEKTIEKTVCDVVIVATPIDLTRVIKINKPFARVNYELKEKVGNLEDVLKPFVK